MSKPFVSSEELRLENEVFDGFRSDMNVIIRELLRNMIARGAKTEKSPQLSKLDCSRSIPKQARHYSHNLPTR